MRCAIGGKVANGFFPPESKHMSIFTCYLNKHSTPP